MVGMRKLCPNYEREDALDTVLEVPIPEEVFTKNGTLAKGTKKLTYPTSWPRFARASSTTLTVAVKSTELQLLLGVIGAPLVPLPVAPPNHSINYSIKREPIEMSTARYIVRQYVAATGGEKALEATNSMYAIGKVKMNAFDFPAGVGGTKKMNKINGAAGGGTLLTRLAGEGEMGGFVFWQKKPDLWCLELVVSGCKITAGSDGKVAWRQTPWHPPHASRGSPRPLRRALQGLDPLSTSNLFSAATCIGEKTVNGEGCYVLRLDADAFTLRSRNTTSVDVLRHTVWGSFSHRTGLLVHLEDSHLLRVKSSSSTDNHHRSSSSSSSSSSSYVYWETTMESFLEDYRPIDGILIAHSGRTLVSLFRFGDSPDTHTKTRMEERWTIEEIEFQVRGLSKDCFLPPADMNMDSSVEAHATADIFIPKPLPPSRPPPAASIKGSGENQPMVATAASNGAVRWMASSKVAAVEEWIESSMVVVQEEVDVEEEEDVEEELEEKHGHRQVSTTPFPIRSPDCITHPH